LLLLFFSTTIKRVLALESCAENVYNQHRSLQLPDVNGSLRVEPP